MLYSLRQLYNILLLSISVYFYHIFFWRVFYRYDVRGTVYDLRSLEPLGGGASDALWSTLSDAERKVEQLCDEERYRALYHNEAEEAMYQGA